MRNLHRSPLVPAAAVLAALLLSPGSTARDAQDQDEDAAAAAPAADAESAPDDAEQDEAKAKEARIAEYLRKKEERRLEREQAHEESTARELERQQLAKPAALPEEGETEAAQPPAPPAPGKASPALPRGLVRAQERVRRTNLDDDPTVVRFLQMVEDRQASPHQLAAFGNFLSDNGLHGEALAYYDVALRLVDDDPVLWVNVGTLHRKVQDLSAAASSYARALSLNPNYGLAHYNLGAVFDSRGKYKQALEEYKIALALDPTLGDPAINPQAVSNEHLATVKLMLYEETIGTAGLPLVEVPAEKLPPAAGGQR